MKSRTVKELIQELEKIPDDWTCRAYEGEVRGVILTSPDGSKEVTIHNNPDQGTEIVTGKDLSSGKNKGFSQKGC